LSTKISKDDLKIDQVTKTMRQSFVWTTDHSKMVLGAIIGFVVLGGAFSLWSVWSEKKEISQQEKYFILEKAYNEKKRGFDEVARAEMMAASAKDKTKTPPVDVTKKASGDLAKDYGSIPADLQAMIDSAPGTKAAQMAALNLSDLYSTYGKNDEALAALDKVTKGLGSAEAISALVWMQSGNLLANKGDCKAAVEKWQHIADSKSLAFAQDEAKLRMGLCFESMNDLAKAEELYTQVTKKEEASADFAASREAQKYLRLLKAKKNL
jgi:predicted negative regulator of RcsB-dependent stress response